MEILVREANLSDIDNLVEMWSELSVDQLGKDDFYKGGFEFKFVENQMKDSVTNEKCGIFVAEYDKKVQGFIEVWIDRNEYKFEKDDYAYILHYYIRQSGRTFNSIYSIMFKLYKAAEDWAVSQGKDFVISDAFAHNDRIVRLLRRVGVVKYKKRMVREI